MSQAEQLPSFVKPKKKYQPEVQMKRANWTKVFLYTLVNEHPLVNEFFLYLM